MRRALCVGIDLYSFGALRGCVNDAERMSLLLARHQDGTPNFECRTMAAPNSGKESRGNKLKYSSVACRSIGYGKCNRCAMGS